MKLYAWYDCDSFAWIVIVAESVEDAIKKYTGNSKYVSTTIPRAFDIDATVVLRGRDPQ